MPKKISEETKQKAIALREQGKTYKEISELLCISEIWCKRNLGDTETLRSKVFNDMLLKSKSKQGISKGQISSTLGLYDLPSNEAIQILNNTTAKIRREDKQNIVRPDWMHPKMALYVHKQVMQEVLALDSRLQEQSQNVLKAMQEVCNTEEDFNMLPTVNQIKNAILGITSSIASNKPGSKNRLANWTKSLSETSAKLAAKNNGLEPTDDFWMTNEQSMFDELEQEMY